MAKKTRRSSAEVKRLAERAKVLVDAGSHTIEAAANEVGISRTVYERHIMGKRPSQKKKGKARKAKVIRGSIRADQLPPRPAKRTTNGSGKPVNMNSVHALAMRVDRIDRKLAQFEALQRDRDHYAQRLLALLKKS